MSFRQIAQIPLDYDLFKGYDHPFNFSPSGSIRFGNGVVDETGMIVKELGAEKVALCTDEGLVALGVAQRVISSLEEAGVDYKVFSKCEANPSVETVEAVAELAMDTDLIIGLGGGSSIDPAKAAAILVTNGGNIRDYEGCDLFENEPLPVVAIPTAAGTGAEVTCFAVITDVQAEWKMAIGGSHNIPSMAICDPELTATMPPAITAATGMDALTHAIEGFVSRATDPISDAILAKAIKLIYGAIRRASFKGEYDKEARYDMMMGATMAGMGFVNTILGISHSMAHPLGAIYGVPHGVGNAICLPVISEFNMYSNLEKYAECADLFGKNTSGLDPAEKAQAAIDALYELVGSLPVPPLSRWVEKVDEEVLRHLADEAMKGGDRYTNPRETTPEDFIELYRKAFLVNA